MATMRWAPQRCVLAAVAVVAAACGRDVAQAQDRSRTETSVRSQLGEVSAALDTTTAARLSGAFRAAAERALPAVVQVDVIARPRATARRTPRFPFPFFPDDQVPQMPAQASGSGFIFDQRGYIMTNHHVVDGATQLTVRMVDGREYDAQVVGGDPQTDVAVIKIEPRRGERLPVAALGDSDQLRVGDWVLALGNPLGLDFTVTAGIVSAKGRSLDILRQQSGELALEAFIQTDAAINPGNSGGPLVDLLGRVVGINSAIESQTGFFAGAGFAIPINLARKVADDLLKYGVVRRPRLGVQVEDVSDADAEVFRLPAVGGAEVKSVQPGTPAERAGLRMGDVIVALDGRPIRRASDLTVGLALHQPGDRVTLTVIRYGTRLEVEVELGQFETEVSRGREPSQRVTAEERLGFAVTAITPEIAEQLGLPVQRGVVITEVDRFGPAAAANVEPGYVLLRINGRQITTPRDVERIASELKAGDVVSLLVLRGREGETIINYRTRR
jgi:serine protease Do